MSSPLAERRRAIDRLRQGVDVLVIGGGITGAGVALDAATRGYRVSLVEQADFASGTSSRSTKLVHGGLRYLPQLHVSLVREALQERDRLLRSAPHLVRPLGFLIPVYTGMQRPLGIRVPQVLRSLTPIGIRIGLLGYDLLARSTFPHRSLPPAEALRRVPGLRSAGLRAAFLYYDAQTDDVRLTHTVLATARRHGAMTLNYARATAVTSGPTARVTVVDRLTQEVFDIDARHVVNATGVWAEEVARLAGPVPFRIHQSKGVHLILDAPDLLADTALVIPETDDGRLAFLLPWRGRVVLGTTDASYDGDLAFPLVEASEALYLLDHLNRYLHSPIGREAIIGAYAGLRPLVHRGRGRAADLPRDYDVVAHGSGMLSIIGGKLTTYRKMAEDVVDLLVRRDGVAVPCRTHQMVLHGGENYAQSRDDVQRRITSLGLEPQSAEHLLNTYGSAALRLCDVIHEDPSFARPLVANLPVLAAEVVFACREEHAVSLADWLIVRSRLALLDRENARGCAPIVASLMGRELGWSEAEQARQLEEFRKMHDREMAFLRSMGTC